MWQNKKTTGYRYIFAFVVSIISLMAICSYTIGYTRYLKAAEKQMKSHTYRSNDIQSASGNEQEKVVQKEEQEEVLDVANTFSRIEESTNCVYKNVDLVTTRTTTTSEKAPKYFVGLTWQQLEKYYEDYMQNIPRDEVEKGLQTINIINFSDKEVTIEKVYDISKVGFYVVDKSGEIKVYFNDKKTLYENTGIVTKDLPDSERMTLEEGIYVDSKEELMAILESYSS